MMDLLADNLTTVLPLAAAVCGLLSMSLILLAWRGRQQRVRALLGSVASLLLLFTAVELARYHRIVGRLYEVQQRTGLDLSAFTFRVLGDETGHRLDEFRGKPVLLYFWATTCGPCRPSLPVLARLASEFRTRAVVILLSTEDAATLLEFRKAHEIPSIAAYAPAAPIQTVAPTTFLIDARGVLRRVMAGSRSADHLRARLQELAP